MKRQPGKRKKPGHIEGDLFDLAKSPAAAKVALAWALPDDVEPVRMRNEYSSTKTAVAKVFEEHRPWGVATTGGTNEQLIDTTQLEFIFQDLLKNRVSYVRNKLDQVATYAWRFGIDPVTNLARTLFEVKNHADLIFEPTHAVATSTFRPHGDVLFAERDYDTGVSGLQIDCGPNVAAGFPSTLVCTFVTAPITTSGTIVLQKYVAGDWVTVDANGIVAGTAVYTFTLPVSTMNVYSLRCDGLSNDGSISVVQNMKCGVYGHYPAPSAVNNLNSIEGCRVLGHSIKVTNIAAPQYQEGRILAYQPGKARDWRTFCPTNGSTDPYAFVRDNQAASPSKIAATGFYTFVKPTEEKDIEMRTPVMTEAISPGNTIWTYASTPIEGIVYVVVCAQINVDLGRDVIVRTAQHLEFPSSNQFFNVMQPVVEPSEWRDGMEALASLEQYYENPVHWRKILNTIGAVAQVGARILGLFPQTKALQYPTAAIGSIVQAATQ